MGADTHAAKHTHRQTYRHINTMTRPGLRAGQSENQMQHVLPILFCMCITIFFIFFYYLISISGTHICIVTTQASDCTKEVHRCVMSNVTKLGKKKQALTFD